MARLIGKKAMHIVVSHIPGVRGEVNDQAKSTGRTAQGRLASHRRTGDHEITVTQGEVDSFVNLQGSAPESVEFGHWVKGKFEDPNEPKYVPGLYVLTGSAELDANPKQGPRRKGR